MTTRRLMVMNAEGGGAGGGTGTPPPATGTPPPAASPWNTGFTDENKGYVEMKGFKDAQAVVDAYRNAEGKLGVPPDKLLRLPEKDDAPEWQGIYNKMGRPEKADGYQVDMGQEEFTKWTKDTFHKLGLSKRQGDALAKEWGDRSKATATRADEQAALDSDAQLKNLQREWGAAFETKKAAMNAFTKAVGVTPEQFSQFEAVLGLDGFAKFIDGVVSKFGIKLGEAEFRTGDGGTRTFGAMSPQAAKAQKNAYLGDPEWVKRYTNGEHKEKAQMEHVELMIHEGKQIAQSL